MNIFNEVQGLKVGHDSECFAIGSDGVYTPMIGNVGGDKKTPWVVPGGNLQEDNVSIEMAVDATDDRDEFVSRTKTVFSHLVEKVEVLGMTVVVKPSIEFNDEMIRRFYPKSIEQGCLPDWNVYTKKPNRYPSLRRSGIRHGSGHIHVDCIEAVNNKLVLENLVMLQDILLKIPQWLVEGDVPRNLVQGNLGNYRKKPYGVEYRSSSNIILKEEEALTHAFKWSRVASVLASMVNARVLREDCASIRPLMALDDKASLVKLLHKYEGKTI